NSTSVPEFLYNAGQKSLYFPGANKHPDEDFAEIGSLGEVKLPTGGYQVFEYELDDFRNTDFDDYNYLPVHNFQEMHFEIIGGDTHSFNVNYPILAEEDSSVDFTKGYNYNFYFDYANNPNIDLEDGEIPMGGITYYVAKIVKDGNELPMNIYGGTFTLPDDFFVQGSDYSVIIRKVGSGTIAPFATFGSIWVHDYITYPQNRQAGTLRVKSITLLDSGRQDLIKRSYKYTDFDDSLHPEISSGVFTATKPFPWSYITSYEEYPENHPPITYSFLHIPDNGLRNLNSSFGKSVIYQKVTETYVSTKEGESLPNHKKEYVFSLPPEQSPQMAVPNLPLPHTDYLGGLILEQRMKNEQNQLVKLITNSYNNVNLDMK